MHAPPRTVLPPIGILLLLAAPAHATDTWTTPHPGVRLLHRTTGDPLDIVVAEVDLCERGVSLRATAEDERQRTTSSFGALVGAAVAINGDFFSYDDYRPTGLAASGGTIWSADSSSEGFIVGGRDHAWLSAPSETWSSLAAGMEEAVAGRPLLVDQGVAGTSFSDPSHCADLHPRTAVGLSEDRQTLWLVVVDGRSTTSEGMTCASLASLLAGLGAWTALNLDGGGSSTLWVSGLGVENEPSDGSERTVSNHLAVLAEGSGAPESCDFWLDELRTQAHALDDDQTDLDGDGSADACARAGAGLSCYPLGEEGFGEGWTLDSLSDAQGWSDVTNHGSLRMGDITGDGLADVCVRGDARVYCWPSTGAGFGPRIDGPELSDATGWDAVGQTSSLRLADVDGDGDQDLCGRGAAGFSCWPSTGTGFGEALAGPTLSDDSGWSPPDHSGTIRMGDVDGDGRQDVCARAGVGMYCWLSDGAGFPTRLDGPAWSDEAGFDHVAYWSTIRLLDLDGDGRSDLCARGPEGVDCHLSTGDGFGEAIAGPTLSDDSGWFDHSNYATLRAGDVDGDGDQDFCARADARMYCWLYQDGAFPTRIDGPEWSDALGWDDHRYYTTIRLADVTGDGRADLCARSGDGLRCHASLGTGFGEAVAGPGWSDEGGWDEAPYYTTLRIGGGGGGSGGGGDGGASDGGASDGGTAGEGDSGGAPAEPRGERVGEGGCGCGAGPGASAAPVGLLALAMARRRRRN